MKTYAITPEGSPGRAIWLEDVGEQAFIVRERAGGDPLAYAAYQSDLHMWYVAPARDLTQWRNAWSKEEAVYEVKRIVGVRR